MQLSIGREVAVKLLNAQSDALGQRRDTDFLREAQIASRLRHPNVVQIHDFGIDAHSGQPFLVMELLRGHDLRTELLRHGPMVPERCARLVRGVLDALALGHESGIVHKDLKPPNLFLDGAGTARERLCVLDYGIARFRASEGEHNHVTIPFGTPAYLAPEVITGKHISPAIDVYQMALIIVEMLTGQPLVRGATPFECIVHHSEGRLHLAPWLKLSALGPVLADALCKDPLRRIPNAASLADRLFAVEWSVLCAEDEATGPQGSPAISTEDLSTVSTLDVDLALPPPSGPMAAPADALPEVTPPHASARRRPPLLLAGLCLLCLPILVFWWWSGNEAPAEQAERATALAPVEGDESALLVGPDHGPPAAKAIIMAEPEQTPQGAWPAPRLAPPLLGAAAAALRGAPLGLPQRVRIPLDSRPSGASVWLEGQRLGETPLNLHYELGRTLALELRMAGHSPTMLYLIVSEEMDAKPVLGELKRQPAAARVRGPEKPSEALGPRFSILE